MTDINKASKAIKGKRAHPAIKAVTSTDHATTPITGVPTEAQKAKARAKAAKKPRGGKPGSAVGAQSAVYAEGELTGKQPARSDTINMVKPVASGGDYTAVEAPGQPPIYVGRHALVGEVAKHAKVGGSYKALVAALEVSKAERVAVPAIGVTSQNSPHTAKAIADRRAKKSTGRDPVAAKLEKEGIMKTQTAKKGSAKAAPAKKPAAAKPTKVPTSAGPDRKYKSTKKKDESKPGSFRTYMITTIRAHHSTQAAKEAHAKSGQFAKERLNFKWAHDNGYIVLADLA